MAVLLLGKRTVNSSVRNNAGENPDVSITFLGKGNWQTLPSTIRRGSTGGKYSGKAFKKKKIFLETELISLDKQRGKFMQLSMHTPLSSSLLVDSILYFLSKGEKKEMLLFIH